MVTRYTKAWPEEVIRYINENITADFESGTLFRNGVKIEGSLVNPKPRQYLAFGCRINGKFRILKVHQVIFYLYHGKQAKLWIDHIDGDPLNNAISNLREVTKEQNQANMIPRKKTKSGYKGVHPRVDNRGGSGLQYAVMENLIIWVSLIQQKKLQKPMMLHHWNCMVNMDTGILADS